MAKIWQSLVLFGASAGFHAYVYNACQHARAETSQSPLSIKHIDACHIHEKTNVTRVTWIETITPQ